MSTRATFYLLMAASLIALSTWSQAKASEPAIEPMDLFDGIDAGDLSVQFIAKSDRRGRILMENTTDAPITVRIPAAFVGKPVLEQNFGGGGGGGGLGGGGGGGGQSVGGGGGGGGGRGGGGGGGGQFSIPPGKTTKLDVPLLCLDHGKKNPSSSKPYVLVRADEYLSDKPEVVALLEAFGRGELQRGAAQAAAWNLNSGVSWEELSAKMSGTVRSFVRSSYFSRDEITSGIAYSTEAVRRAQLQPTKPTETQATPSLSGAERYEE